MTIEIDGSQGEGGGQVLRTALSLSVCTGQDFVVNHIRAKRKKPGLMRQHLTAVKAAQAISGAEVEGAEVGSTRLHFRPDSIQGGDYRFEIGTAGSCTLVLQTILPVLMKAPQDSRVVLTGGTHNSMSPPYHFMERAFVPQLAKMGVQVELQLQRFGFYPAGGGEIVATIKGSSPLQALHLRERGERISQYAESYFAGLPAHIAQRELAVVKEKLGWADEHLLMRELSRDQGPGNILMLTLNYQHVTEVVTGFGERGVAAEVVAKGAVASGQKYIKGTAAVGSYLADQLLLPMALAGGGSFTADEWSQHASTNASVIAQFLPITIQAEPTETGAFLVTVSGRSH